MINSQQRLVSHFMIFLMIFCFCRFIFWIDTKEYYFNMALRIKYSLKEPQDGDVDRIRDKMIKKYIFINPFIWTKRQCIKDHELYNYGLDLIEKIEEKENIEKKQYDKTFTKRIEERD